MNTRIQCGLRRLKPHAFRQTFIVQTATRRISNGWAKIIWGCQHSYWFASSLKSESARILCTGCEVHLLLFFWRQKARGHEEGAACAETNTDKAFLKVSTTQCCNTQLPWKPDWARLLGEWQWWFDLTNEGYWKWCFINYINYMLCHTRHCTCLRAWRDHKRSRGTSLIYFTHHLVLCFLSLLLKAKISLSLYIFVSKLLLLLRVQ